MEKCTGVFKDAEKERQPTRVEMGQMRSWCRCGPVRNKELALGSGLQPAPGTWRQSKPASQLASQMTLPSVSRAL